MVLYSLILRVNLSLENVDAFLARDGRSKRQKIVESRRQAQKETQQLDKD